MRIHLTTKVTRILRQRLNLRGITALYLVAVLTAQLAGKDLRFSMKMMPAAGRHSSQFVYRLQSILLREKSIVSLTERSGNV